MMLDDKERILSLEKSRLETINELAARWHRHSGSSDKVEIGMCLAWCQAIALIMGMQNKEVFEALKANSL